MDLSSSFNSSIPSLTDSSAPPLLKPSPPPRVEFWYDDEEDEEDEESPKAAINFLEECGMCKRRLGAGRDAYMCGGEAVFCSEECRSEWIEMNDPLDEEKCRRRTVKMMKKLHGAVEGERRDLPNKFCYSFSTQAAEICGAGTVVAG